MIRRPIPYSTRVLLGVVASCLLVVVYAWLSHRVHVENPKNKTIPNWSQYREGWSRMVSGTGGVHLGEDAWNSAKRLVGGVGMGILLAFLFGMAMGCLSTVDAFCMPLISFFAKIPPTAMLAVYFVFVGVTGNRIFVALIALGIFPTLAQSIAQAAKKDVDAHAVNKSYTLGASHFEVVWEVIFKQTMPRILESIRLQIGPAMVFLIAAEWALADVGFGYTLRMQSRLQNMNIVYTYLLLLGAFGLALDQVLTFTRRKVCPWFGE